MTRTIFRYGSRSYGPCLISFPPLLLSGRRRIPVTCRYLKTVYGFFLFLFLYRKTKCFGRLCVQKTSPDPFPPFHIGWQNVEGFSFPPFMPPFQITGCDERLKRKVKPKTFEFLSIVIYLGFRDTKLSRTTFTPSKFDMEDLSLPHFFCCQQKFSWPS